MSQFCPLCGAQIGESQRFCTRCGAAQPAGPQPAAPRGAGRLPWLIFGGLGLLGLLLLFSCAGLILFAVGDDLFSGLARPGAVLPSPTAAPTSTPAPDVESASGVFVYDDFSNPRHSALTAEDDDTSRTLFEAGAYAFEVKVPDTLAWAITDRSYGDLVIEADTEIPPGSGVAAAGLIFHYRNNRNFYLFSVASDGYYALEMLKDDTWQTLIDWTESDVINTTHNTLRVETKGNLITLKANGSLLEVTQDDTLAGGDAGLAVSSFETGRVTIRFDNLLITRSP